MTQVVFESGEPLPVDGVFIAYGTAGSADFARKLGAQLENGRIQTDIGMATGSPACLRPETARRGYYRSQRPYRTERRPL